MSHLTFKAVSVDGSGLILIDADGNEFTLTLTPEVRTALSRTGQLEKKMDSSLRPRDIQARIRAGESPEAVASAASMSIEKVMIFAGPVLAEREHIAQRAQSASVRRASGEGGHARTLGESVTARFHADNLDPETIEWDAWRREDGRWSLLAAYDAGQRQGAAAFTFDAPGNYVVLEDDDARWLVGEITVTPASSAQPDDLQAVRSRRLAAVSPDQLPLGDDAIEMVGEPVDSPAEPTAEPTAESPAPPTAEPAIEHPSLDDFFAEDDEPEPAQAVPSEEPNREQTQEPPEEPVAEADDEPAARRPVAKKKGRASVPSWDEIMFGGGDQ